MTQVSARFRAPRVQCGDPSWQARTIRSAMVEVEWCWRPGHGRRSGDFCVVVPRPDGSVGIVLGDAPGRGREAASLAEQWSALARAAFRSGCAPAEVLAGLDRAVSEQGPDTLATAVSLASGPHQRWAGRAVQLGAPPASGSGRGRSVGSFLHRRSRPRFGRLPPGGEHGARARGGAVPGDTGCSGAT